MNHGIKLFEIKMSLTVSDLNKKSKRKILKKRKNRARVGEISYTRRKQLCSQVTAGRCRIESIFAERNNKCSFFPLLLLCFSPPLFFHGKKSLTEAAFDVTKIPAAVQI